MLTLAAANPQFAIPPGDSNYRVDAKITLQDDSTLIDLLPHMHFRGKDFEYRVTYPSGEKETLLNVPLSEKSASRVAWAQVNSVPKGAEIIVDGTSTGKFTPARVQVPSGVHTITLQLNGFQPAKRTFQVSEGGTVPIDEALHQK